MTFEAWLSQEPWLVFTYRLSERRFKETYDEIPAGPGRALEIGAPSALTAPTIADKGYAVEGVTLGPPGTHARRQMAHPDGRSVGYVLGCLNVERDTMPFEDESFDLVVCCEVLEHLLWDPSFMMGEINRVLKTGGQLILLTPNIVSWRSIASVINGFNPNFYSCYPASGTEPKHAREYTPWEVRDLLEHSGFLVTNHRTVPVRDGAGSDSPDLLWTRDIATGAARGERVPTPELRQDVILIKGQKQSGTVTRPEWLYG